MTVIETRAGEALIFVAGRALPRGRDRDAARGALALVYRRGLVTDHVKTRSIGVSDSETGLLLEEVCGVALSTSGCREGSAGTERPRTSADRDLDAKKVGRRTR